MDTSKLYNLRPVKFTWKIDGRKDIGLIAEEAYEAAPELAVTGPDNKVMNVNWNGVTVLMLKALKEQKEEIEELKAEIKKLKN
ncbi:MAG: tail fiber domain-containing protein [Elusimicrobia bacterium]|nr:tail fiber domain-containing protein [Elusimicrobiota bacterium]